MAWTIEFGREGKRDFARLDNAIQRRIYAYLAGRIALADDARNFGKPSVTASRDCGVTVLATTGGV